MQDSVGVEREARRRRPSVQDVDLAEVAIGVPGVLFEARDDDERSIRFIGAQIVEALGYAVEEWLVQGDIWSELLHPDDRETVLARWDRCRETGVLFEAEYRLIGVDGRRVWFHDRARRARKDDGTVVWHGLLIDVTTARTREQRLHEQRLVLEGQVELRDARLAEVSALMDLEVRERRRAEAGLEDAERRLATLKAATRDSWMYTWTVVGGTATGGFNSRAAVEDFDIDLREAELAGGTYWRTFVHPLDVERVWEQIHRSTSEGVPFEESYRWVTPDGRTRWILDHAVPTTWDPVRRSGHFVGMMVDVTDLMEGRVSPEA